MDQQNLQNTNTGFDLDALNTSSRPRVLVIDDEPDTVTLLKHIFQRVGFDVSGAISGKEGIRKINEINPSLILLDMMMPEMDGWETIRVLRQITGVPILIISALGQSENIVSALQLGADDYITKPFNPAEVIARSQAVLRRGGEKKPVDCIAFPEVDLMIDLKTQEVYYQKVRIQLTGKMFEVLMMLAKSAPHVVSYEELAKHIWGENSTSIRNRLKYLIYLLRQEFNKVDQEREMLKNVDRLGYKLLTSK